METIKLMQTNQKKALKKTIQVLAKGGLVISPSDTVYGVLVDATKQEAVKKLIQFKNRPWGKPISVFAADFKMLEKQVEITPKQINLLKEMLPGPFTIVLPSRHGVSKLLESEKGLLGIRIPNYSFLNELVKIFRKPVSATSANLSGRSPHYSVQSLMNELPEKKKKLIDLIVDGGQLPRNKPSTVIDLTETKVKVIRKGDIVFSLEKKYLSDSPTQTKKIAQFIFNKFISESGKKALVFILQGELGVGKTIFVKGMAEFLGIKNIVSPTFVIYYEYRSISKRASKLVHIDLYNIEDAEEFKHLGLEKYLEPKNILCFEWGEKAGEIMAELKNKGKIIYIKMNYLNEKQREISIKY